MSRTPRRHSISASPLKLVTDHAAFLAAIRAQLGEQTLSVVVIDTLNRSMTGSENDDKDMAAYTAAADAVRDAFNCLVIIVHHCGHNAERPRGHSSLLGAVDALIAVKRDAAGCIVAELELAKDGAAGLTFVSKLETVEIGIDEDGDPITSLIVVPVEGGAARPAEKSERQPPRSQRLLFDCVNEALGEHGEEFRPYTDGPKVKGVDDKAVRRIYYARVADQALPDEDQDKMEARRVKAFQRAVKSALDAKSLAAIERDGTRFLWLGS